MKDPSIKNPFVTSMSEGYPGARFFGHGCGEDLSPGELRLSESLSRLFRESIKLPVSRSEYHVHGYRAGELHESNLWQIASGIENARPFSIRESIEVPDFHIGILVDCSGSMCSPLSAGSRIAGGIATSLLGSDASVMEASRCLALGLATALDGEPGVHLSVCGHTELGGQVQLILVKRPDSPLKQEYFSKLVAMAGNLDGLALVAYAREMNKAMSPEENGIIVLISDGAPCHSPVIMKKAFDICKKQYRLSVYPIGVGYDLTRDEAVCIEHYGSGNYSLAVDVVSAAPKIVSRINNMIQELKPM